MDQPVRWSLFAFALVLVASSCGGTQSRGSRTTTTFPRAVELPPAEQVCQLLSDDEVNASVGVEAARHMPALSGPRSCSWVTEDGPGQVVVQLSLASQQWFQLPLQGDVIEPPCPQGSKLAGTARLGNSDALHATCLVDGLAVFLTATTAKRAEVLGLLDSVVSRLGSINREAFGFGAIGQAPPECVEAWRARVTAPPHCEDYPEAYKAIREQPSG